MADLSARQLTWPMATMAVLVAAVIAWAPASGAQEPGGVRIDGQPCTDNLGVTVVVDLQELGDDTVFVRCAPEAPADGFAALTQAGIPYREALTSPGFLCRIFDRPETDPCDTTSPADAYWSYWLAPAGGPWCYSNYGAGNRTPPPGAVEGWSFALDKVAEDVPPPRLDPPAAPAAGEAEPLAADDCTTPGDSGIGADSDGGTQDRPAPVGRGDAVNPDAAADAGSPVGVIVAVAVLAGLAMAAAVVTLRRRRATGAEAPLTEAERANLRSPLPIVDRHEDLDDPSISMWAERDSSDGAG